MSCALTSSSCVVHELLVSREMDSCAIDTSDACRQEACRDGKGVEKNMKEDLKQLQEN